MASTPDGARLDLPGGDVVILSGIDAASLGADDFLF
jgi:hypothetical protein